MGKGKCGRTKINPHYCVIENSSPPITHKMKLPHLNIINTSNFSKQSEVMDNDQNLDDTTIK